MSALCARLPDGRLHLQHGPIDVIAECWGPDGEVEAAYGQAWRRFRTILEELVAELPRLRAPVCAERPLFDGTIAKRMATAVWPHGAVFVTPMAAVAGAVADELMQAMIAGRTLDKGYVNDGGDIALHLSPGHSMRLGVADDVDCPSIDARALVSHADPVRGVATSGWRGRSQSLGIADAVTVLAASAAAADAAATLIANAVDAEHPAIERRPAREVKEDSDLGERPVTVRVGPLPCGVRSEALARGAAVARAFRDKGSIHAAYLSLQGERMVVEPELSKENPLRRKLVPPDLLTGRTA